MADPPQAHNIAFNICPIYRDSMIITSTSEILLPLFAKGILIASKMTSCWS